MKIILSRKGVDSSAGGFASPIFPDGQMISVPIPDDRAQVRYRDMLTTDSQRSMARLVRDLSRGRVTAARRVHVDPDLQSSSLNRARGWRPAFGQCGAAQSHLAGLGVGPGDLFLFFGWFRQAELYRRRWRYVPGAPDQHVVYGWMQIESVKPVSELQQSARHRWAHEHPHCIAEFSGDNVVYISRPYLDFTRRETAGAGVFVNYNAKLRLSREGSSRSLWRLPLWMHPAGRASTLSYHSDIKRWDKDNKHAYLRSAARGQEFVLDLSDYPEGKSWARKLISLSD